MPGQFPDFDLYEELEVSARASAEVIHAAYQRLARMHHPDVNKGADSGRMGRVNAAHEILQDASRRAEYDTARARQAPPRTEPRQEPRQEPPREARQEPKANVPPVPPTAPSVLGSLEPGMTGLALAAIGTVALILVVVVSMSQGRNPSRVASGTSASAVSPPTPTASSSLTPVAIAASVTAAAPTAAAPTAAALTAAAPTAAALTAAAPTAAAPTAAAPQRSAGSFPDGAYAVGSDIAVGTYRNNGTGFCVYYKNGNRADSGDGQFIVTIDTSWQTFRSTGCGTWARRQ